MMARTPKPTAAQRLEAAQVIMGIADHYVNQYERVLAATSLSSHPDTDEVQASLVAAIDIWKEIQALASREIAKWSGEGQ